ncbi:MAG: hypothetical protein WC661_17570 [Opitutaceae bacterium]|jgi:hypothetical protein
MKNWLIRACVLLGSVVSLHAEFAQLGPVETLDNGAVTLDVALRVGRIVSFHRHNEPDWLVIHDEVPHPGWNWNPWGGDRMWPTSQALNYQIYRNNGFDPVIDGKPWELIAKTATTLEMRSGISPQLGLQVTHRIELVGKTTEVVHTYRIKRLTKSNFPVHVWTVTGVRAGDFMLMESDARVKHEGYKPYKTWTGQDYTAKPTASLLPDTRILQVHRPSTNESLKLGTYGRWIALVDGPSAFLQITDYLPDQLYLDACNLEAFMSKELATYELEALSPSWFLRKGESREWTVRWRLVDFPAEAKTPPAKAEFLQAQLEEGRSAE